MLLQFPTTAMTAILITLALYKQLTPLFLQNPTLRFLTEAVRRPATETEGCQSVAYPGIFFGGGSTNAVEDRGDGDLGAVAP